MRFAYCRDQARRKLFHCHTIIVYFIEGIDFLEIKKLFKKNAFQVDFLMIFNFLIGRALHKGKVLSSIFFWKYAQFSIKKS